MSVSPSTSTQRQRSRSPDASASRNRANAARRGDQVTGRVSEPTGTVPPPPPSWTSQLVLVTGATAISGATGRYTGSLFALDVSAGATGALTLANLGSTYGSVEIWHPPDIGTGKSALKTTDLLVGVYTKFGTVRNKPIVVTLASVGGSSLPTPTALYQVLISMAKTDGTGGYEWVAGRPRVY